MSSAFATRVSLTAEFSTQQSAVSIQLIPECQPLKGQFIAKDLWYR